MKFFQKLIDRIKSPFTQLGQSAEYDWHFALWGFAVGLFVVLVINVFTFITLTSTDTTDDGSGDSPVVRLTKDNIDKAIKNIEQRDVNASSVPSEILKDPSL